jgi:glycosyltransferase involved in cell wall biosynthesis
MTQVLCFDPTSSDTKSKVRGVGRYLQILKENFPDWTFSNKLQVTGYKLQVFINPFFNFLQKPVTLKRIAKKQIAVIHDLIPLKYPSKFPAGIRGNFNIFLNKLALKKYDLIVTDSLASKKDIIQILKIPEEKVRLIYPCLPQIFNKKLKTQNSKPKTKTQNFKTKKNNNKFLDLSCSFDICDLIFELDNFCLYVGDATWNKNLVNLARAIKIANVTCVFVGKVFRINSPSESEGSLTSAKSDKSEKLKISDEGRILLNSSGLSDFTHPWQKELKEFFQLIKDDKRFIFLGYVADEDLIKLYQQASLNILPSRDEGFGFSYLEASSQGCPSVLSDIPVFKEIAKDTAFFANPENPNDIADKIIELYFNKNRQKILGEKAKKRIQFFSCEKFKKSFLEIID